MGNPLLLLHTNSMYCFPENSDERRRTEEKSGGVTAGRGLIFLQIYIRLVGMKNGVRILECVSKIKRNGGIGS